VTELPTATAERKQVRIFARVHGDLHALFTFAAVADAEHCSEGGTLISASVLGEKLESRPSSVSGQSAAPNGEKKHTARLWDQL
jgi:hypothetical protein